MISRLTVRRLDDNAEPGEWMAGLCGWVTAQELAAAMEFAPRRRREYLTWRAAVRQELGRDVAISYDAAGAPQVDCGVFIGVSHSKNLVAVCIGELPCAVDTEPLDRNFERVRRRFMTLAESALSDDSRLAAAIWCAKEALYKLGGHEGCDFLRDIRILSVDFAAGRIVGTVHDSGEIALAMEFLDDNIIVCGEICK